jgi:hypothetical protein
VRQIKRHSTIYVHFGIDRVAPSGTAGKGWEAHLTPLLLSYDCWTIIYYDRIRSCRCVHELLWLFLEIIRLLILGDEYTITMDFDSFDRN